MQFWESFEARFGEVGRPPITYYGYEVGHILGLGPDQMGKLTPADLLGAAMLFDHLYRGE